MLRMNDILGHSKWNEVKSVDDFGLAFILGLENDVPPEVIEETKEY